MSNGRAGRVERRRACWTVEPQRSPLLASAVCDGGGSVAVGAILRPRLRCGSGDVVCQQQLKSCTRDGRAWRVMPTR